MKRPGTAPRHSGLLWTLAGLAAACGLLVIRQNLLGGAGGPISLPKLLWLNYALAAWFVVSFGFWRSPAVPPAVRRVYGAHLLSFGARGVVELMLLARHAWIPPYGMAHDLFTCAMLTLMLRASGKAGGRQEATSAKAALRFLTSLRLGILCDALFAWLFYQAVRGNTAVLWFAAEEPRFRLINGITWVVVAIAYADLARTLRDGREALAG